MEISMSLDKIYFLSHTNVAEALLATALVAFVSPTQALAAK
jgi:hypothetical protein